jgi:protein-S-isoprenylcysteine O-methyltransferase Ste14
MPSVKTGPSTWAGRRRFVATRLFDTGAALPLILIYAVGVAVSFARTANEIAGWPPQHPWRSLLVIGLNLATIAFAGVQIILFVIRRLPEARATGVMPYLAALAGSNVQLLFLFLPRARENSVMLVAAPLLVIFGLTASCLVMANLGRSFSILPQARGLVTRRAYRWVRHPLYLAELFTTLGIVWQFAEPWALLALAVSAALQFPRMHYEEQVLRQTYPDYSAYMQRTWRLIPAFY